MKGAHEEMRCVCRHKPLLAICGSDRTGAYIHVKVYKQKRLYSEIFTRFPITLRCRDCKRFWNIAIPESSRPRMMEHGVPEPLRYRKAKEE